MWEETKVESLVIQRMIQRSNDQRCKATSNHDRDEERAVILKALGADQFYSAGSSFHTSKQAQNLISQRINYEDKNFRRVFPWNALTFTLAEHLSPERKVEKKTSAVISFPDSHSTQKTPENFKESISNYSPMTNGSNSDYFKTEHICSRTDSSITSSPNGSGSNNKTGNTEFSDCFYCNAMVAHKYLCKWKKETPTKLESSEKAPIPEFLDNSTNTYSYGQGQIASNVLSDRTFLTRDEKRAKIRQTKRFKSPLRTSSPDIEITIKTEFLVSQQQRLEQLETGTSMESISTIPDKQSDCSSLSETKEYKDLEAMVLHAAEVNEIASIEDVTQLADTATYNVERFLRDALGDEMDISVYTDSLDSQATMPEIPEECCTSNHGEPLFHTISSYRMLTNLKRQKVRPHLSSLKMSVPDAPTSTREKQLQAAVQSLLSKAEIHMSIMIQASKALDLCDESKEFISSRERVECERLLLVSTHIRNATYEEIHRLKFEDSADANICFEKGSVHITELAVKVKKDFETSALLNMEMKTWFLCLMSHNSRVLATKIEADVKEGYVRFSGCYTFTELRKDFTIKVQVYCLKLRKQIAGCQSKHLSLMPMNVFGCPVLCKREKNSSRKLRPDLQETHTSSFALVGELHLHLNDVHYSKPWPLHKVPLSSPLVGTIDFELKTSLKLTAEYSGFLNLSEETSLPGSWQKYWFYLKEHTLFYWNYPSDKDTKVPVGVIDLSKSLTNTIGSVGRNLCARPRTFVIETGTQDTSSYIKRYFLSADTALEMNQWCCVLNKVIKSLREWKIIHFNF